jgi:CheY-like chemotaxis protein
MARVPSFAQTEQPLRPLATAVRRLAVTGRVCPNCGSPDIRPSNRRNALDVVLACLFLSPYRCRFCRIRFYRVWRPSLQRSPAPPVAPMLLIPARRKALAIDGVSTRHIEPQPVPSLRLPQMVAPGRKVDDVAPELLTASTPASILILEEDLSIRKLLRRLLERRGYHTVEIERMEDLAGELLDRAVDLLIVDVSTAEAGLNAVVKLARALPDLKILALSAEALKGGEVPGRLLVLPKPFPLESFVDSVDRMLGEPKALDSSP